MDHNTPPPVPQDPSNSSSPSNQAEAPQATSTAAPGPEAAAAPTPQAPPAQPSDKDVGNIAVLIWVGTIFLLFIPGLFFYLDTKYKENAYIQSQAKEALNWSINVMIGYLIGSFAMIILIGFLIIPIVMCIHLLFCIMGAIAASSGKEFKVPFMLRLVN